MFNACQHHVINKCRRKNLPQFLGTLPQLEGFLQQKPDPVRQKTVLCQIAQQLVPGLHTIDRLGAVFLGQKRSPLILVAPAVDILIDRVHMGDPALAVTGCIGVCRRGLFGQRQRLFISGAQLLERLRVILRVRAGQFGTIGRGNGSPVSCGINAENPPDIHGTPHCQQLVVLKAASGKMKISIPIITQIPTDRNIIRFNVKNRSAKKVMQNCEDYWKTVRF